MRKATTLAALSAVALLLAGCASEADQGPEAPAASQSAPSSSSTEQVGTSPDTWAPMEVTQSMNGYVISMFVGQKAVLDSSFSQEDASPPTVESSNPGVVTAVPAGEADGVTTAAGFAAVGEGKSTVTVKDASGVVLELNVEVAVYDPASAPQEQGGQPQDQPGAEMSAPASSPSPDLAEATAVSQEASRGDMPIAEAEAFVKSKGYTSRVVEVDGVPLPTTKDYSDSRINFTVKDGIVTGASVG